MIKFEEHDGLIFKMLEEHEIVPLKENDANVLVRFITHGVIGEYVMEHWLDCNQKNVPIYVENVDSDGDVTVCIENGNEHHCCPFPMFEIIGTHVKEGSADWALHQMMKGEKVTKQHLQDSGDIYWCFCDRLRCVQEFNCGTLQITVIPEIWVKTVDKCGWQIYKEPKPKPKSENIIHGHIPADMNLKYFHLFKVGDWVEWCGGQYMVESAPPQSGGRYDIRSPYDELGCSVYPENITRKLDPSEVVIRIGCLSGTVEKSQFHKNGFILVTAAGNCWILFDALDTETRTLVESLLKAQEEE